MELRRKACVHLYTSISTTISAYRSTPALQADSLHSASMPIKFPCYKHQQNNINDQLHKMMNHITHKYLT